MNYFVTALPRSRTAWFSEFLPNCLHEGMVGCYTHKEYISKLGDYGDSSSALMFFPIKRYFPDSPVLIIERDFDEVIKSLEDIDLYDKYVYEMLVESKKRLDRMNGLRVDYHNLDLEEIWDYLIGSDFDQNKANEMDIVNIQKINRHPDMGAFISIMGEL